MPTVDIPDKICSHCGDTKWYYLAKRKTYTCIKLLNERNNKWRKSNIDHFREKRRKYFHTKVDKAECYRKARERILKNPDKVRKYEPTEKAKEKRKQYRILNAEKVRKWKKEHKTRQRKTLSNLYLKQVITQHTNLLFKDIPQDLVEMKRNQILLKRKIKNNDNKEEQHSN